MVGGGLYLQSRKRRGPTIETLKLLWITEAKEDVGKCRGGDMEAKNRGEGPPTGKPQGRTACRGATGERGEEGVGRNE
jgi:hypothetical protein